MKKTLIAMISFVALGLAVGCDSGTPCDEAASVQEQGITDACAGNDCQFCECWRAGQNVNTTGDGCVDREPTDPVECEGANLTAANSCLDNRASCAEAAGSFVDALCPAP